MAEINLSLLPKPDIIENIDYEEILARRKVAFINLWPVSEQQKWTDTLALESEPVTKVLEESAYMEMLLRQRINHSTQATMLAYATGNNLDNLAANFATKRLVIVEADASTTPPTIAVYESDEDLRKRTQLAFEAVTTAGPVNSYKYHALTADGDVKDVGIKSPAPGEVLITVLSRQNDGTADVALQEKVYDACNAENVRPLCDTVIAQSATINHYDIIAELILYPSATETITLDAAKQAAKACVNKHHAIGHDITLSAIYHAIHQEGVQNVTIVSPVADIIVNDVSAAFCDSITLTMSGRDV